MPAVPAVVRLACLVLTLLIAAGAGSGAQTPPQGPGDPTAAKETGGLWVDKSGFPTYHIAKDGTVDWGTFVGYLRYNSICLVCHGPDGSGSSFAPDLTQSLRHLTYAQFVAFVAGGKRSVNAAQDLVMPAWGKDKNVMCFINEIYSYLRARSTGAVERGRPEKVVTEPKGFEEASYKCLGIPM